MAVWYILMLNPNLGQKGSWCLQAMYFFFQLYDGVYCYYILVEEKLTVSYTIEFTFFFPDW